jgi:hypothetical protein
MARALYIAALVLFAATAARGQDIVDNPAPKNGDVCRDAGDLWRNIKLGPCEAGTKCQAYKRGAFYVFQGFWGREGPLGCACVGLQGQTTQSRCRRAVCAVETPPWWA